jgi:hypothetical protein
MNEWCINPQDIPNSDGYYIGKLDVIAYSVPFCIRDMVPYVILGGITGIMLFLPIILHNIQRDRINTKYK